MTDDFSMRMEKGSTGQAPHIEMPPLPPEEQHPVQEPPVSLDEAQAVSEEPEVVVQAKPEPSDRETNFRILREKAEKAERERDELIKLLQEQNRTNQVRNEPEEDLSLNLSESDIAEGRHLTKMEKKIRRLEDELSKQQRQSTEYSVEAKIKSQYSDFDQVVNQENLRTFTAAYPELAQTLNSTSDLYSKAVSAYTMIKKFGIYSQTPFEAEKELVKKNSLKPKAVNTVSPHQGSDALSRANAFANGLTEDLRKQLFKEMNDARKGM